MKIIGKDSVLPEEVPTYVDVFSETEIYMGYGKIGALSEDLAWAIKRLSKTDSVWTEEWAGGMDWKDKVWNDRLLYSYSPYGVNEVET